MLNLTKSIYPSIYLSLYLSISLFVIYLPIAKEGDVWGNGDGGRPLGQAGQQAGELLQGEGGQTGDGEVGQKKVVKIIFCFI